jgi:ATP-binding cassette subfamily B protein
MLGERGVTVSGGQKQRLTIARAVLTDPRILILDDALSAVDADTEIEILTSLKDILRKRSVIIISARPRSLAFADEILVMDEGHIVERGRHEELIAKDGLYALFAKLQGVK